jgi:hypothetical protein
LIRKPNTPAEVMSAQNEVVPKFDELSASAYSPDQTTMGVTIRVARMVV